MTPYTRQTAEAELAAALQEGDTAAALRAGEALDKMPPPPKASLLGSALWYAEHGLPVFPVRPLLKVPYTGTRGVLDASTDPDRIRTWWQAAPDSNIGLATGHKFDVIDIDGLAGNITLARDLLDQPTVDDPYNGLPPILGVVLTPRPGGRHLYIDATGRPNRAGWDGIDYRGRGGYVLAPPSRTADGLYEWLRPLQVVEQ